MLSMTGYVRFGSKWVGRMMIPQMSVTPSRPLATKTSGYCHPVARSAEASARSSSMTSDLSAVLRSSAMGGRSTLDHWST